MQVDTVILPGWNQTVTGDIQAAFGPEMEVKENLERAVLTVKRVTQPN